jgi:hypothetical protein
MTAQIKPTRDHAIKIIDLLKHGLTHGKGDPEPGAMCVEAAVCYAMGLPHGDEPPCVAPDVRSFKIALNDSVWSSNMARANGLRRLAIAQLGSNEIDQCVFAKELALATVRKIVPIALRAAAKLQDDKQHKEALENHASKCEAATDRDAARAASDAARYAARAARYAARAASDAARYAARAASYAARAASYAARDAARAASYAASYASDAASYAARYAASYASYAARAARDSVLCLMAECAVEALIICRSPGCEWLDLAPKV